jgi:hypothetical protein
VSLDRPPPRSPPASNTARFCNRRAEHVLGREPEPAQRFKAWSNARLISDAKVGKGAFCMVPAAKAERPVSVQLADPRGNARQGGRCADNGHSRDRD